jgi:hypothetical protein
LLFGAFAAAQYGRPLRGGGGTVAPRVLSNLLEAREIAASVPGEGSIYADMVNTKDEINAAIRLLQKAMRDAGVDPNRLPPPMRTSERDPSLVRLKALLDDTHRLIASGREYNGDLRARLQTEVDTEVRQAQEHTDKALSIKQGQFEEKRQDDRDNRDRDYDRRRY